MTTIDYEKLARQLSKTSIYWREEAEHGGSRTIMDYSTLIYQAYEAITQLLAEVEELKEQKNEAKSFEEHIQKHLDSMYFTEKGMKVVCKICGKTAEEIRQDWHKEHFPLEEK